MTLDRNKPLRRKTPLRSKKGLKRSGRLKRGKGLGRNDERREREWRRAYESEERVQWVQRQPSVASGDTPCVNAHVNPPGNPSGMGRKPDAKWIVPLTWEEHGEYHQMGQESFEAAYGVDLTEAARETERLWQERCDD